MESRLLKKISVSLVIIGMIFTAAWALDARYAKASDVQAQIQALTTVVLEFKLLELRKELAQLKVKAKKRDLDDDELVRMEVLKQKIRILEAQMGKK